MALTILWTIFLCLSLFSALLTGQTQALSAALLQGAQAGAALCVSLSGALCLWSGLAKLLQSCGLMQKFSHLLRPFLSRIFPETCRDEQALGYLSANFSANLLGLGSAATPMGIACVRRMQTLSGSRTRASDEMCRLIVMNTASLQLIPSTVAALRASLGAERPFEILPAVWLSSACSVAVGLLAARCMESLS